MGTGEWRWGWQATPNLTVGALFGMGSRFQRIALFPGLTPWANDMPPFGLEWEPRVNPGGSFFGDRVGGADAAG